MRTTLNLNEDILKRASQMTGIHEKTALVHEGLKALIGRQSSLRLAKMGGTMKGIKSIRRRRFS